MCIVIVGSLIGMLSVITIASRHPAFKSPRVPSIQGPVLGGTHIAEGGRSVAPDRDAPAELTETELQTIEVARTGRPGGPRPEVPAQRLPTAPARVPEQAAQGQRSGQAGQAAPLPGPGPSDQAEQALPRQRSGEADKPERTTTER
jgi:hypothetical protein